LWDPPFFPETFAGGAGRILRGTFGLFKSDREQALRRDVPCPSDFGSSGEVLGEFPGGLLLAPELLLSSALAERGRVLVPDPVSGKELKSLILWLPFIERYPISLTFCSFIRVSSILLCNSSLLLFCSASRV